MIFIIKKTLRYLVTLNPFCTCELGVTERVTLFISTAGCGEGGVFSREGSIVYHDVFSKVYYPLGVRRGTYLWLTVFLLQYIIFFFAIHEKCCIIIA